MARAVTPLVLGEGIHEAEIQEVLVKQGAAVEEGNAILAGETDKAMIQVLLPYSVHGCDCDRGV
jgi:pyruvate/2-oxoglutarate dehydrogenase complex dihydrolipoamide acyltransferase (E2) component